MTIKISARDYYYANIKGEMQRLSYQKEHHLKTFNQVCDYFEKRGFEELTHYFEEDVQAIVNHQPIWSNDYSLENLLKEITENTLDENIRKRLNEMFFVKDKEYLVNAYVPKKDKPYSGDLIFFNVGLSDLCYQYSILFTEFLSLASAYPNKGKDGLSDLYYQYCVLCAEDIFIAGKGHEDKYLDDAVEKYVQRFLDHAFKLANNQDISYRRGNVFRMQRGSELRPDNLKELEISIIISAMTDKFILCHEIAHALLGHTGSNDDGTAIIEKLNSSCQAWNFDNPCYAKEYQADALALLLILGLAVSDPCAEINSTRYKNSNAERALAESVIGSLLELTVLGQCFSSVKVSSERHPSIEKRFQQLIVIFNELVPDRLKKVFQRHLGHIRQFQGLLWSTQGSGLGLDVLLK